MALDTRRFLELTLLLSASACAKQPPPPESPPLALAPSPQAYATPAPSAAADAAEEPPMRVGITEVASSCNDGGDVAACDLLNPACESGSASFCRDPETPLRSKIREAFAACVKKAEKGGRCEPRTTPRSCLRQAVSRGCIDPAAEESCKALMSQCKAAGKPIRYDLATCAKILSAVNVRPGTPEWQNANLELLGPTAEGRSCALDYVLPFYPFGH